MYTHSDGSEHDTCISETDFSWEVGSV